VSDLVTTLFSGSSVFIGFITKSSYEASQDDTKNIHFLLSSVSFCLWDCPAQ